VPKAQAAVRPATPPPDITMSGVNWSMAYT
jgi:hypothetical protein